MKKTSLLMMLLVAMVWTGCHKDKGLDVKDPEVTDEEMTVTGTQARFSWKVDFTGQFQTGVEVSRNQAMTDIRRVEAIKQEEKYVALVDGLTVGTKYYYRIVVWNTFKSYEQPLGEFTTTEAYAVTLSCLPEEGGIATGGGSYFEGDTCTVTATANTGYYFVNWTENGTQVSTAMEYTFLVTTDRTLVANFTALPPDEYVVSVSASPSEGGTVTGGGTYRKSEPCTLTATTNEGYSFVNWTKVDGTQVSTEASYTFTVTESVTYVAHFQLQSHTVGVFANPTVGGQVIGGGTFNYGENCTVAATANTNYTFVNWTENGNEVSTEAEYTFPVTSDRSLVANFTLKTYTITTVANPEQGGTITGSGSYTYGDECTLTATPNEFYSFVNWTKEDGTVVSIETSYTCLVLGNRTFTANFEALPQFPTGAINGLFTINENGDQVYFSQGNLQYMGGMSPSYWKFADNQWQYFGSTGQGSTNQNVNRDLFGWGTSGYHDSGDQYNVNYYPYSISKATVNSTYNVYGYGPSTNMPSPDLTGYSENYDWGVCNPISNGGNTVGQWRTLTYPEWEYVMDKRNTLSGMRYVKAQIVGTSQGTISGLILLPDDWSSSYYPLVNSNQSNVGFDINMISASVWTNSLEAHGAVFLPAAGYRTETTLNNVGSYGYYWASTKYNSSRAYYVFFHSSNLNSKSNTYRYYGCSVRLVCPAQK